MNRHTTKLKSDIAPRLVESLVTLVVDIGLDNLHKVPVGGVDVFPENQQALLDNAIPTYRHICMCRYIEDGEWAGVCSCGGCGGWCLVYRGGGHAEDDGGRDAGDLMLAVEGTRLGVKAYKQFETAMDKQRYSSIPRVSMCVCVLLVYVRVDFPLAGVSMYQCFDHSDLRAWAHKYSCDDSRNARGHTCEVISSSLTITTELHSDAAHM